MTYDELLSASPTETEYMSREILKDILLKEDWRCYSSRSYWGTDSLIERFLRSHARLKGIISEEIYADLPATIIHLEDNGSVMRGATFLNGAIIVARDGNTVVKSLFVDEKTAKTWAYPDDYVDLRQL